LKFSYTSTSKEAAEVVRAAVGLAAGTKDSATQLPIWEYHAYPGKWFKSDYIYLSKTWFKKVD
jgi:hypothetical protein